MLFNSYEFILIFLPVAVAGFYLIGGTGRRRAAIGWLVAASLFFYGWWNPTYLLLLGGSIIGNFMLGQYLTRSTGSGSTIRRPALIIGVIANLGSIGFFKYANFFVENANALAGTTFHLETIVLPLAISFFTFQQITYLVDSYRGLTQEHDFLNYCLFVTFFPQLIAGPIVHHSEMLPQFTRKAAIRLRESDLAVGLTLFAIGLFKKAVLADGIAGYSTPVFNAAEAGVTLDLFTAWGGALSYTLQLYFDFSGYSDMALGGARLFGIKLPPNFNSPYQATNIIDFWRRWHITLSRFLRDYLYIPLGGNRLGATRRQVNLMLTMLIGGLWHGAGWTFVAWGGLHGLYLVVNHSWRWLMRGRSSPISGFLAFSYRHLSHALTLLAVIVGWVFFRAESFAGAMQVLEGMVGLNGVTLPAAIEYRLQNLAPALERFGIVFTPGGGERFLLTWIWVMACGFIALALPNSLALLRDHEPALGIGRRADGGLHDDVADPAYPWRPAAPWAIVVASLFACGLLALPQVSEFLYYQF